MSGVSIVNQVLFVVNLCVFGAVGGAGIFGAQFHGRGDTEGVKHTLRFNLILCALISAGAWVLLVGIQDPLIRAFLHDSDSTGDLAATLEYGKQYLHVMFWTLPPFAVTNAYAGVLRVTGGYQAAHGSRRAGGTGKPEFKLGADFRQSWFSSAGCPGRGHCYGHIPVCRDELILLFVHRRTEKYPFVRGCTAPCACLGAGAPRS